MTDYLHTYFKTVCTTCSSNVCSLFIRRPTLFANTVGYNTPQLFITTDWKFSVRNGYETVF